MVLGGSMNYPIIDYEGGYARLGQSVGSLGKSVGDAVQSVVDAPLKSRLRTVEMDEAEDKIDLNNYKKKFNSIKSSQIQEFEDYAKSVGAEKQVGNMLKHLSGLRDPEKFNLAMGNYKETIEQWKQMKDNDVAGPGLKFPSLTDTPTSYKEFHSPIIDSYSATQQKPAGLSFEQSYLQDKGAGVSDEQAKTSAMLKQSDDAKKQAEADRKMIEEQKNQKLIDEYGRKLLKDVEITVNNFAQRKNDAMKAWTLAEKNLAEAMANKKVVGESVIASMKELKDNAKTNYEKARKRELEYSKSPLAGAGQAVETADTGVESKEMNKKIATAQRIIDKMNRGGYKSVWKNPEDEYQDMINQANTEGVLDLIETVRQPHKEGFGPVGRDKRKGAIVKLKGSSGKSFQYGGGGASARADFVAPQDSTIDLGTDPDGLAQYLNPKPDTTNYNQHDIQ